MSQNNKIKGKKIFATPLEYIDFAMDQMNLKQIDLVRAGCGNAPHVSEMVNGKRPLTIRFIREFCKITNRQEFAYVLLEPYLITN